MSFSLLIDTAFETCQVALLRDGVIVAQEGTAGGGQHDRVLAGMTDRVLLSQNVDLKRIEKIIVTTGPGRFTGLRVGIAFARGLALVHQTPLVGVLTTDALAWQVEKAYPKENAVIVVAVKRGETFVTGSNHARATESSTARAKPADAARSSQSILSAIRSVKDEDIVSYIKEQGNVLVCGVLSPVVSQIFREQGVRVADDVTEPSPEAIAAIGMKTAHSGVVRPYYAESYVD